MLHSCERVCQTFQFFQSLDVEFERLPSCSGTRAAYGVRRLYEHRFDRLRLYVAVVRGYTMNDSFGLLVFTRELHAYLYVSAFVFVIDGFTEIVQQTRTFTQLLVGAELSREQPRDIAHLERMLEYVLSVTGTEFHPAEQLDELRMYPVNARVEYRAFAGFLDGCVHIPSYAVRHFLYPSRMYPSVGYQFL